MERKIPKLVISLGSLRSNIAEDNSSSVIPNHLLPTNAKLRHEESYHSMSIPHLLLHLSTSCFNSLSETLERMPNLDVVERKRLFLSKLAEQMSLWQKVSILLSWSRILSRFTSTNSIRSNLENLITESNKYHFEILNIASALKTRRFPACAFEPALDLILGDSGSNLLQTFRDLLIDSAVIDLVLNYGTSSLRNIPDGFRLERSGHRLLVHDAHINFEFKVGPSQTDSQTILWYLTDLNLSGSHKLLSTLARTLLPRISSAGKSCWDLNSLIELVKKSVVRLYAESIRENISELAALSSVQVRIKSINQVGLKLSLMSGLYEEIYPVDDIILNASSEDMKTLSMNIFNQYMEGLMDKVCVNVLNFIRAKFSNAQIDERGINWHAFGLNFVLTIATYGYRINCVENNASQHLPHNWMLVEEIGFLEVPLESFVLDCIGNSLSNILSVVLSCEVSFHRSSSLDQIQFRFQDIPHVTMIIKAEEGKISFSGTDVCAIAWPSGFSNCHDVETLLKSKKDVINPLLVKERIKAQGLVLRSDYQDSSLDVVVNAPLLYPCCQILIKIESNSIKVCRLLEDDCGQIKPVWTESSIATLFGSLICA